VALSPKELAALAKACRKAGITHYKQGDVEFTLAPEQPRKVGKRAEKQTSQQEDTVDTDGWDKLSEEDKLFYSATGGIPWTPPEANG